MTKGEYIDFIKNNLTQLDQTARYHSKQVEYAIEKVFNQVYYDMAKKSPNSLERYSVLLTSIDSYLDTNTNRYVTGDHSAYVYDEQPTDLGNANNATVTTTNRTGSFEIEGSVALAASDPYIYSDVAHTFTQYDKIKITISSNNSQLPFDIIINEVTVDSIIAEEDKVIEYTVPTAGSYPMKVSFTSDDDDFEFILKLEFASVSDLDLKYVDLPLKASGVLGVRLPTSTTLAFVPMTTMEMDLAYGADLTLGSSLIGYSAQNGQLEFFGMSADATTLTVRIVQQFSEYDASDEVYPPYGKDFNITGQVLQILSQIPPKDLVNDNSDIKNG